MKLSVTQVVKKFSTISEYSLLYSQQFISGPYSGPPECSPYPITYFFKINLVLSTNLGLGVQWSLLFSFTNQNFVSIF